MSEEPAGPPKKSAPPEAAAKSAGETLVTKPSSPTLSTPDANKTLIPSEGLASSQPAGPGPLPGGPPGASTSGGLSGFEKTMVSPPGTTTRPSVAALLSDTSLERALATLPNYQIEKKLGEGGMGSVFRARQVSLKRTVAIKVLSPEISSNKMYVQRLVREAEVLAKINHPNVVSCYDCGEHMGMRYVVMEFVEGESLGALIENLGHLPEAETLDLLKQAVLGLDQANAMGIIHRDIKPDNMLLTKTYSSGSIRRGATSRTLKIADLGLATQANEDTRNTRLTQEGTVLGSPHFMSPEQTLGEPHLDFRTDMYALGITVFNAATGDLPHAAPTVTAILAKKLSAMIPDPRQKCPELSPGFSLLLQKMTARKREDRYESYEDLLKDIEAVEQKRRPAAQVLPSDKASMVLMQSTLEGLKALGVKAAPSTRQPTEAALSPGSLPPAPQPHKFRNLALAAGVAVLVAAAVLGFRMRAERQETAQIVEANETARGALQSQGKELAAQIEALKNLKNRYPDRTGLEMQENQRLFSALSERQEALKARQDHFSKLLEEANLRKEESPGETLKLLTQAEELGAPDAEKAYPDLVAEQSTRIGDLRKDAAQRMQALTTSKGEKEFEKRFDRAQDEEKLGNWSEAVKYYTEALAALGNLEHLRKETAKRNLANAEAEIQKRKDYRAAFERGDACLKSGQFADARKAFEDAQRIWKDAPDGAQVEAGLRKADEAVRGDRLQAALAKAQQALDQKRWAEAEQACQEALGLVKDSPEALAKLSAARYEMALARAAAARQQQKWAEVVAALEDALKQKPGDPAATQALAEARGKEKEAQFQQVMTEGKTAEGKKDWAAALVAFTRAKELRPDSHEAMDGYDRALRGEKTQRADKLLEQARGELAGEKVDVGGNYSNLSAAKVSRVQRLLNEALALVDRYPPALELKAKLGYATELSWDLGDNVMLNMVLVPEGSFTMGLAGSTKDEEPEHTVTFAKPFYISVHPVTRDQFERFTKGTNYKTDAEKNTAIGESLRNGVREKGGFNWTSPGFNQDENHPAVLVTYQDAEEFLAWAGKKVGRTLRLPTEAEWEYAARGPRGLIFPWGADWDGARANHADLALRKSKPEPKVPTSSNDDNWPFTSPRDALNNKSWCGAYDLCGNVYSWCADWYSPLAYDQGVPATGQFRVIRGGSWLTPVTKCKGHSRDRQDPAAPRADIGFRVVMGP